MAENLEIIRRQVAIAGRVTDEVTGYPVPRALVRLTKGPPDFVQPMAAQTAVDGHFHFLDLPDGDYAVTASLPEAGSRYGTAEVENLTVSRNGEGGIAWIWTEVKLPPTTISGKITNQGASPVKLASVRVKGSGEKAFSDDAGEYRLIALEIGNRTVSASAPGLQAGAEIVQLDEAGKKQVVDIVMTPANS